MANEEQLAILHQGVEVWNKWREENIFPDSGSISFQPSGTNLDEIFLIDLEGADLAKVDLSAVDLSKANLRDAKLLGANLSNANLQEVKLRDADLRAADLRGANLSYSECARANLIEANLSDADFRNAYLPGTKLWATELKGCNFTNTLVGSLFPHFTSQTIFGNLDLSRALGLENLRHFGPSTISTDTFVASKGNIPEEFLRGCGLSDWEIEAVKLYNPDLSNEERNRFLYRIFDLQASQAVQISPLFISYSHVDSAFIDKLEDHMNEKGIRFWRDTHEMRAGRIETQIDRGIRQNPTVLLVLSESSLSSDWVEHEVRTARGLEKDMGRDVLCPVALDDSWKSSRWPKRIMEQIMEYNILDFSAWEDDVKFEGMFRKLIDGLELFYKG